MNNRESHQDFSFLARLFYFGMHFLSLLTLAQYNNPLKQMVISLDYEPVFFFILIGISVYLFLNITKYSGNYPSQVKHGFPVQIKIRYNPVEQDFQNTHEEQKEYIEQQDIEQQDIKNHDIEQQDIQLQDIKNQDIEQQDTQQSKIENQKTELYIEQQNVAKRQFCDICQHLMFFRTKHCKRCGKCIPKFDHHCFWLGGCIGERNQRQFYMYLITQSIVHCLCLQYFWHGMNYTPYSTKINDQIVYSQDYGAFLVLSVVMFALTLLTVSLLAYHSYLIANGLTTWEHNKHRTIGYLKMFPTSHNPFDEGLLNNLKSTFFLLPTLRDWKIKPYQEREFHEIRFNYFSNEYYSCC